MKQSVKRLMNIGILIAMLTAALAIALPGSTAYAAEPAQGNIRLENLFKREQIIINNQQTRLNLSNQVVTAAQTWISDLQAAGKDTSALETALANFQNGVAQAQSSFNSAKSVLDAHVGFDGSGKLTDATQALTTLVDAGRAERQFHLTITQATIDFRQAVRQYRQSNP
jgi:hypothetical protein